MNSFRLIADKEILNETLVEIAQLHVSEIKSGFLSQFGEEFLYLIYKAITAHRKSFIICALDSDKFLGFICGSTHTWDLYSYFCKTNIVKTLGLILPIICTQRKLMGIIETIRYPKCSIPNVPKAEILNFVVNPIYRSQGVGNRLLHALGVEFRSRGVEQIRIVCGSSQSAAMKLYLRNGAKVACNLEIHRGITSKVLVWETRFAKAY